MFAESWCEVYNQEGKCNRFGNLIRLLSLVEEQHGLCINNYTSLSETKAVDVMLRGERVLISFFFKKA